MKIGDVAKNVTQAAGYTLSAVVLGTSGDIAVVLMILVIASVLAAFESSKFLSAVEVLLTSIVIIMVLKGLWLQSLLLCAFLGVENVAFLIAPVRGWLEQLDKNGGGA
jgi:hypothetical protein